MKRTTIIVALVILVILAALTAVDSYRSRSFVTRVQNIKVGDSKERVVAALGRATDVFTPPQILPGLGVGAETWAYGKRFDWQHCFRSTFPYFWPLRVRVFNPDSDDFVIRFDSAGKVMVISIPPK